jgi:hypothetical protein
MAGGGWRVPNTSPAHSPDAALLRALIDVGQARLEFLG